MIALAAIFTVQTLPEQEKQLAVAKADVSATNFMAYRRAVIDYVTANPSVTGEVGDSSLTSYFLPGYVRDAKWRNEVSGSAFFIYVTQPLEKTTEYRIFEMSGNSVLVGRKDATSGRLISVNGVDSGVNVPAAIPNNAFVMMGK